MRLPTSGPCRTQTMNTIKTALIGIGLVASLPAIASTDITTTFQSKIVIVHACTALSASLLDFGSPGVLSDRKRVVEGKSGAGRLELVGCLRLKKKKTTHTNEI